MKTAGAVGRSCAPQSWCASWRSARLPPTIATGVPMRPIGLAVIFTLSLTLAPIAEPPTAGKVYRIGYLGSYLRFHDSGSAGGFDVVSQGAAPFGVDCVLDVGARLDRDGRLA